MTVSTRLYESEADLHQMLDMLMAARAQTDDWRYAHVGELLFNFFMVECHLDPREFIRLWHDGGKLAGYVILGEDPSVDLQVLPEYEGRGIESAALDWVEARLVELRARDAKQWGGPLVSGSRQDHSTRIAFLESRGFHVGGEFSEVNMLCSLDEPVSDMTLPDGYQVRSMGNSLEEISNRAAAQRGVWLPWTVGEVNDEQYARFMQLPGYRNDLDVVALAPDGVIAAYVNGWLDPLNRIGDFGPVGALPAYRRQGLTRAVLLECLRRMKILGMNRVCVSTGLTNLPAIRLYESVGFRPVNRYIEYVKPLG